MNTIEIYNLLLEASNLQSIKTRDSLKRRNKIHGILKDGCNSHHTILDSLLNNLYVTSLQNAPTLLPKLLPVFVLLCGDRDTNMLFGQVDWDFINDELAI